MGERGDSSPRGAHVGTYSMESLDRRITSSRYGHIRGNQVKAVPCVQHNPSEWPGLANQ
jgi:hypothetical protein